MKDFFFHLGGLQRRFRRANGGIQNHLRRGGRGGERKGGKERLI